MTFTPEERIEYWKKRAIQHINTGNIVLSDYLKDIIDDCEHIEIYNEQIKKQIDKIYANIEVLRQYIRDAKVQKHEKADAKAKKV